MYTGEAFVHIFASVRLVMQTTLPMQSSHLCLGHGWLSYSPCIRRRCAVLRRWRKLEGSDPSTYEMIQKIQTLQKRLIGKTEEVVEKDLLIQVSRLATDTIQS